MAAGEQFAEDEAKEFMLAEYQTLRELHAAKYAGGDSTVNFYLGTISAALVGLTLLNQFWPHTEFTYLVTVMVYLGVLLFGFVTFARTVERSFTTAYYKRGMNLVRKYFVERHPELAPYLILPISDVPRPLPSGAQWLYNWKNRQLGATGLPVLVLVINSMVATVGIVAVIRSAFSAATTSISGGAIVFLLLVAVQAWYAISRLRLAARMHEA